MAINTPRKQPDKRWSDDAKRFWNRTLKVYVLTDEHHLAMLFAACQQLSQAAECQKVLDKDGLTIEDRHGQTKAHPLLAEQRSCLNSFRLLTRELGLDVGEQREIRGPRAAGYA